MSTTKTRAAEASPRKAPPSVAVRVQRRTAAAAAGEARVARSRSAPRQVPPRAADGEATAVPAAVTHMQIAETAYFRAEARGFSPGHELDDWLAAEHALRCAQAAQIEAPHEAGPVSARRVTVRHG